MVSFLHSIDVQLLFFINELHSPAVDLIMYYASNKLIWVPLYIYFLFILTKQHPRRLWLLLLVVALMILATDQAANLFKNTVERFRPTHDPSLMNLVHTVFGYRGGLYGFFSGHAANSAAVAIFAGLLSKKNKTVVLLATFYVAITCYSRIYLGVHYPSDIMAGLLAGCLTGRLAVSGFRYLDGKLGSGKTLK